MEARVDLAVGTYAQLPGATLGQLLSLLCGGVPQWRLQRGAALARARQRLGHGRVDGIDWYWPTAEVPTARSWRPDHEVRLLTPFDPVVWDRRGFKVFLGVGRIDSRPTRRRRSVCWVTTRCRCCGTTA